VLSVDRRCRRIRIWVSSSIEGIYYESVGIFPNRRYLLPNLWVSAAIEDICKISAYCI
jgi:hypothetical protein